MDLNLEAYKDYLSKEKNYSPLTIKAYLRDINSFSNYLLNSHQQTSLESVSYSLIRSWIVYLVENNNSNASINRKVSALKSYYRFLLKIKVVHQNPLLKHKSLKMAKKVQIPFSEKELNDVFSLNHFNSDFEGVRNRLIVELFYATGIRRAELINLKSSNLDFSNKTIKVLGKRNKERIIPLLGCTLELLTRYMGEKKKLFFKRRK